MSHASRVCLAVAAVVVCSWTVAAPVARGQTSPALREYLDAECGLGFSHIPEWRAERLQSGVVFVAAPGNVVQGFIGWVRDVPEGQQSTEAEAVAAAGGYCLDCLREEGKLVWIERVVQGSMIFSYVVSRQTLRAFANNPNLNETPGYAFQFWIFENGSSRQLAPGSQTRASSRFWVHERSLATAHRPLVDVIRSLKFTRPKSPCWQ